MAGIGSECDEKVWMSFSRGDVPGTVNNSQPRPDGGHLVCVRVDRLVRLALVLHLGAVDPVGRW